MGNGQYAARTCLCRPPSTNKPPSPIFLDRETAKIDALVEEQQRLIALLKEKRQAVISHAVTKGLDPNAPMKDSGVEWLGEVPAHWGRSRHKVRFITRGRLPRTQRQLTIGDVEYPCS